MFSPSLAFLRQVFTPRLRGFDQQTIKASATPATVYRLILEYDGRPAGPASTILKVVQPDWPGDPDGHDRERRFYADLAPGLELNHPLLYYEGVDPDSQCRLLLLEDLGASHRFPPPTHAWSWDELRCLLRTYARLHVRGEGCLPPAGQRAWLMSRHETRWTAGGITQMVNDLGTQGIWPPLSHLETLLQRTLDEIEAAAGWPITLLHNDVYPPNGGLPAGLERGEAALIDWEMAGWGHAELDLAYMFTQPFCSSSRLDQTAALHYYWQERRRWEGTTPSAAEQLARQRQANRLLALSLVPVAHHVAAHPFPSGSAPAVYWASMFGVLYRRLQELVSNE
ncbi:MAG: phosphotransferase [Chloroflexota bacterium]